MNALPSSDRKKRSPRVVAMRSTPCRSGSTLRAASTVRITSPVAISTKKQAVSRVQAIQAMFWG